MNNKNKLIRDILLHDETVAKIQEGLDKFKRFELFKLHIEHHIKCCFYMTCYESKIVQNCIMKDVAIELKAVWERVKK